MSALMEYNFTVKGDLQRVKAVLELIKMHIEYRKSLGWEPFQEDEAWTYSSQQDAKVCPICQAFDERHAFTGDEIRSVFPDNEWISFEPAIVYPNTHQTYPTYSGKCRCYMQWIDPLGTLLTRLYNETSVMG